MPRARVISRTLQTRTHKAAWELYNRDIDENMEISIYVNLNVKLKNKL